jgi:hypothetical protein
MTGRGLHDALLRVLTSADLRTRLAAPDGGLDALLGAEEAAALRGADPQRLTRLARFLGRHFYRERIVRLFAASRALARARGQDPLGVLDGAEFAALLASAEVGAPETADRVACLVEARARAALDGVPWAGDLVRYEGVLFRVEAGPRRWAGDERAPGGAPVRAPDARVVALEWDVTRLVVAVRRGEDPLPVPPGTGTRLLVALAPDGRVTTVRCSDGAARLLDACDGARSVREVAQAAGLGEDDAARVLGQLTDLGALTWVEPGAGASR